MRTTARDDPYGAGPRPLRRAGLAALLVAGCLPQGSPPSLVDHPISAAMRFEVIEPGSYAPESPRDDRTVASVMPGDAIAVTPFLIGPDGPLDLAALRPAWFYCRATRCFGDLSDPRRELPRCAVEPVGGTTTCAIGRGAAAELRLGALTSLIDLFDDPPSVYMVAGTPGGPSTPECLAKLRKVTRDSESLQRCLLHIKPLPLGPLWRLMLIAAFVGLPDALPLTGITPDVQAAEADVHVEVPPLDLRIEGVDGGVRTAVVGEGDTVKVAPGDAVELVMPIAYDESQLYYQALIGEGGALLQFATDEVISGSWLFTWEVDALELFPRVTWTVPEDAPATIHGYLLVGDGRSVVWSWLRFEVAGR